MTDSTILNSHQLAAIHHGNGPLLIIAGAGTGKTTVITQRIQHLIIDRKIPPSHILALTFTDKAAYEMQERVDILLPYGYTNLWIHTFHSFCDRVLRDDAHAIGLDSGYKVISEAESVLLLRQNIFDLGLKLFRPLGNPTKFLSALLTHFSRLKDEDITPTQYLEWVRKRKALHVKGKDEEMEDLEQYFELAHAYKNYEQLKIKESVMDFSDLIANTLLLFRTRPNILTRYQKQFESILVDEFQDTNYAQNELAMLLAGKDKNLTVVADDDQCLPGNTLITTPSGNTPIKKIHKEDVVLTGVGKGSLGVSTVNKVFKNKKTTSFITIVTKSGKTVTATANHKMFCYIPKHVVNKKYYYVYLMFRKNLGFRLGITNDLAVRLKLERSSDAIIGLRAFTTEEEARYHETLWSLRYQIPTCIFKERAGVIMQGKLVEKLYTQFNTNIHAKNLAHDLGIELDAYHYVLDAVTRGQSKRVKINFYMCFRAYSAKNSKKKILNKPLILHAVQMQTSNEDIITKLKAHGIVYTHVKKGIQVRFYSADIHKADSFAQNLSKVTGGFIELKSTIGTYNTVTTPALIIPIGNLLEGLYVPIIQDNHIFYDEIVSVKRTKKTSFVYDLEINRTHNFIANGIVVHNSIYRFRGAAVSNVLQFKKNFPSAKAITLNENYRSTQTILDAAYALIQHNNPNRLEVVEHINKKLTSHVDIPKKEISFIHTVKSEDEADMIASTIQQLQKDSFVLKDIAILVRANNHAQAITAALTRHKIPYQFLGPGYLFQQEEIKDFIAYLLFLTNLSDSVALFRVLCMDIFQIPQIELNYLLNFAKKKNLTLFEALLEPSQSFLKPNTQEKLIAFTTMVERHLEKSKKMQAGQILYYFLVDSKLFDALQNTTTITQERKVQNIAKFFERIKNFEMERTDSNIFTLVEWLMLMLQMGDSPTAADVDTRDTNAVNILTVHASKGLEFTVVFLVNLVSDRFPTRERSEKIPLPVGILKEHIDPETDFHLEEERRLFYVGMTRARELLYFTAADYYDTGKRTKKLSPFIYEALPYLQDEGAKVPKAKQLSLKGVLASYENTQSEKSLDRASGITVSYITFSNLQMFDICPLHYKAKVIFNIPTPIASVQSFGISLHNTLYRFYKEITENKITPNITLLLDLLKKEWISEGYDGKRHEEERFAQAKKMLEGFFLTECDPPVAPVGLELPFSFTLKNNVKVFGKIDRVDPKGKGIEIIDYKTGANNPKAATAHELQLAMYALAATRVNDPILNRKPEDITLTLHFLEDNTKKSMNFTKDDLDTLELELIRKIEEIEKSDFACSKNVLCLNCEYKMLCNMNA